MLTEPVQLIVAASLLWLILRSFILLRTPRTVLLESLSLVRPEKPEVTVDELGDTWVSIRWQAPSKKGCRRYRIQVGTRAFEVGKYDETAVLRDLDADTTYHVRVCGVGQHDRLGEEAIIIIHTLASSGELAPREPAGTLHVAPDNPTLKSLQTSTKEVLDQIYLANKEFSDESEKLSALLAQLIDIKKSEDSYRGHLRGELKVTEDSRHALDLKRAKLGRSAESEGERLASLKESLEKSKEEMRRLRKEAEDIDAATLALEKQSDEQQIGPRIKRDDKLLSLEAKSPSSGELAIANDVLAAKSQLQNTEAEKAHARACIETIRHDVSEKAVKSAENTLCQLVSPELAARLRQDLKTKSMLDETWNRTQAEMEKKYIAAYQLQQNAQHSFEQSTISGPPLGLLPSYSSDIYAASPRRSAQQPGLSPHPIQSAFAGPVRSGDTTPPEAEPLHTPALSPSAGGLIPSNLFQDQSTQTTPGRSNSRAKSDSSSEHAWTPSAGRPWLESIRKNSLFFSSHTEHDSWGEPNGMAPSVEDPKRNDSKESPIKLPRRGLSGRIMSNLENKHGNFVRRISRLGRRDSEELDGI